VPPPKSPFELAHQGLVLFARTLSSPSNHTRCEKLQRANFAIACATNQAATCGVPKPLRLVTETSSPNRRMFALGEHSPMRNLSLGVLCIGMALVISSGTYAQSGAVVFHTQAEHAKFVQTTPPQRRVIIRYPRKHYR
jgi:hypothetical protein